MPVIEDFRITEGSDSRLTESGDSRVIEYGYSSASLVGTGSISIQVKLINAANTNLLGHATISATATRLPFISSLFTKDQTTWKSSIAYVKYNGLWVSPIFAAIKVNGFWKRVL
jgi:hypothetical protein